MNRKKLYQEIQSLNLQQEIKIKYGKNYTNCSNNELEEVIKGIKTSCCDTSQVTTKLDKLIKFLQKKRILLTSEVTEIMH